jgi:hypothetical protein
MTKARDLSQIPNATLAFRNRIINGAMMIDQRNAGASVTPANNAVTYTIDRWAFYVNQASKLTTQQSSVAPNGFTKSLLVTSSSAYSVASGDIFQVFQGIEGLNVADLGWGTANAQTVTLSFWVRSSLTGTFGGSLKNNNNTRSYPFSYTISAANTFEYKTITVAGDTSGTWATDNAGGIYLTFGLGVGSTSSGTAGAWVGSNINSVTGATSVVGTNGATFYITGVQLEKGSTATSFDYRPYGTELALCQRYYQVTDVFVGIAGNTTTAYMTANFQVYMRAAPSLTATGVLRITDGYSSDYNQSSASAVIQSGRVSPTGVSFQAANFTGLTLARFYISRPFDTSNIALSAEL